MCTTFTVKSIPVKTRLPLGAWVLFGLVTLFSFASTLVQGTNFEHAAPHTAPTVMTAAASH
jgi:hypothetical protein